jgi:hypothetical protein
MVIKAPKGRTLTPEEAAWLAAAIDGEGTIWIRTDPSGRRYGFVSVYNTNRAFADRAVELLGGHLQLRDHALTPSGTKGKDVFVAMLGRRDRIEEVLRAIRPFLIIKRPQTDELLEWFRRNPPSNPAEVSRTTWAGLSPERQREIMERRWQGGLARRGFLHRGRPCYTVDRLTTIVRMAGRGASIRDISRQLHMRRDGVAYFLRTSGVRAVYPRMGGGRPHHLKERT